MRSARLTRPIHTALAALILVGLALGLLLAPPMALPAQSVPIPTQQPGSPAIAPTSADLAAAADTSKKCANKARKAAKKHKKYKYWVCIGKRVKYLKKKKPPPSPAAAQDGAWTGWGTTPGKPKDAAAQVLDEDDSRCELVPECTNIRTLYRANIKANALYGYRDEIWGAFDVLYFQSFNGASSRYRLKLIWDYGYAIDSNYWTARVRRELKGLPDPTTGSTYFYPERISVNAWTAVEPNASGFQSTEPTSFTGRHHDDLYGSFDANGQVFGTTIIHLPDFHCPSHRCKYYGPTGPV
jgi:hypothetical protein